MITTVTGKNQITIPAKLARQLDLQPGTRLQWSLGENGIVLLQRLPARGALARKAAGMGRRWLKPGDNPITDLVQERAQDDTYQGWP